MSEDPTTDGGETVDDSAAAAGAARSTGTAVGTVAPGEPATERGHVRGEVDRWVALRVLFAAVARKQLLLLVRYPVNTLSRVVSLYVFFAVIFFGGQAVGGPEFGDSVPGLVVGFFLFTMTVVAYAGLAWNVTREAQWGTLEQLFMSPLGIGAVMGVKTVVNVLFSFAWGFLVLAMMMATTGRLLALDPLTVLPLGVLTLASVVGVGFAFGGLALVYKRVENAFQLVQFAFIGLIAAPVVDSTWIGLLPLVQGSALLQRAMQDGVRLWEFSGLDLGLLLVTAVVYPLVGYALFRRAADKARRDGLLGEY